MITLKFRRTCKDLVKGMASAFIHYLFIFLVRVTVAISWEGQYKRLYPWAHIPAPSGTFPSHPWFAQWSPSSEKYLWYSSTASQPGGILVTFTKYLNWLLLIWRSSGSTPRISKIVEFLTLSPSHLSCSLHYSFNHYLKLVIIDNERDVDCPESLVCNLSSCLTTTDQYSNCNTNLFVNLISYTCE